MVPMLRLALAPYLVAVASCATQHGLVEVVVTNEDGPPFRGALIALSAPEEYERQPTDENGIVRYENIPTGKWIVEIYCPSANFVGRPIEVEEIRVNPSAESLVRAVVPKGHCDEPPYAERVLHLRGYYKVGFEDSYFEPCNAEVLNLSKNTFSSSPGIWVEIEEGVDGPRLDPDKTYFVEFEGTLKGPGSFGHLGGSDYEVDVTHIAKAQVVKNRNCARDAHDAA